MDIFNTLSRTLGFSFAAGINLYATVAILGFASRYEWVELPDQFRVFDNNWIIGVAIVLYLVEFVADKIPWIDSVWDAIHTVIRPAAAAFIAVASVGHTRPAIQVTAALVGAALASSSHLAKAGARIAANTSPEPFSNWMLSVSEDGFVVALSLLTLKHPLAAAVVVIAGVAVIIGTARWLFRRGRDRSRLRA